MSNYPFECLPSDFIYYEAKQISRHSLTRFDIMTHFFNPITHRHVNLKLPLESILLYHNLTPVSAKKPKKLHGLSLKNISFKRLNQKPIADHTNFKIYNGRLCFVFDYYSKELNKNIKIQLPKLVLARDLFFSHPYLLRAALFAENYLTDIIIDYDDPKAIHIFVAQNKKISKQDISDPHFLKKLTLILLQPALNRAFLSIFRKTIEDQSSSKFFNFNMEAPEIENIDLDVSYCCDESTGFYRIERIEAFRGLNTEIDRPVQFHFTSKKIINLIKEIQKNKEETKKKVSDDKTQLDPKKNANIDKELAQFRNITSEIYTTKELKITLNTSSIKIIKQKHKLTKKNQKIEKESFAGGEGDEEGTLPGFTIKSEIFYEQITHQDLTKMLKELEKHNYRVEKISNLPFQKYARFRGHILANKQPRHFYAYKILNKENIALFYLCEIDTSDGKKSISTLMFKAEEKTQQLLETEQLNIFKIAILAQSLRWPKEFLKEIKDIHSFITINHPSKNLNSKKSDSKKNDQDSEKNQSSLDWAKRILAKVESI